MHASSGPGRMPGCLLLVALIVSSISPTQHAAAAPAHGRLAADPAVLCGEIVTDYADSGMSAYMVSVLVTCSGERILWEVMASSAGPGTCDGLCEIRDPVLVPANWELRGGRVTQKITGYSSVRTIAGCDLCGVEPPTNTPLPPTITNTPQPPTTTNTPAPPAPPTNTPQPVSPKRAAGPPASPSPAW